VLTLKEVQEKNALEQQNREKLLEKQKQRKRRSIERNNTMPLSLVLNARVVSRAVEKSSSEMR